MPPVRTTRRTVVSNENDENVAVGTRMSTRATKSVPGDDGKAIKGAVCLGVTRRWRGGQGKWSGQGCHCIDWYC
ncbi:hypothetical protein NQ176_g7890 [Zarea fungicola]|uniref:Uncharacterized protein n=1 Tax=Zarea fungicola TaxID=93591 RepID=A0ACC1MVI5_9HYPO|nr:hypothetical protein NQ176_g7890 [Lecanicillium fungicola]